MKVYDHPECRTVYMVVLKSFYIKEKDAWSLKVQWIRRRDGGLLCQPYRLTLANQKFMEFKRINDTDL
jgi:hypothetical protein